MNRVALVITLALMSCCSSCAIFHDNLSMAMTWKGLPIYWSFASNFPADERDVPRDAFNYWNAILLKTVFVEVRSDDYFNPHFPADVTVYYVDEVWKDPYIPDHPPRIAMTSDDRTGVVIFKTYMSDMSYLGQATAIRHEAGHVLGLSHSDDKQCIMYRTVDTDPNWAREACGTELKIVRDAYHMTYDLQ